MSDVGQNAKNSGPQTLRRKAGSARDLAIFQDTKDRLLQIKWTMQSGPSPIWKDVVDRVGKALQALDDSDQDVGNTAVPQIMTTRRPENPKCRRRCIRRRLRWTTAVCPVGPRGSDRFTRERPATPARGSGDASVLHDPAFDSFAGLANVLGEQCTLLNSLENPLGLLAI